MSIFTNPVKAISSWFHVLEHILPPEVYAWVKKILSDEGKAVAKIALENIDDIIRGDKTIEQVAEEALAAGIAIAKGDAMDIIRTYTTKPAGE